MLVINWEGDRPVEGNNLLRRILFAHYLPRTDGELVFPPVAHNTQATYYYTGLMDEAGQIDAIEDLLQHQCRFYTARFGQLRGPIRQVEVATRMATPVFHVSLGSGFSGDPVGLIECRDEAA